MQFLPFLTLFISLATAAPAAAAVKNLTAVPVNKRGDIEARQIYGACSEINWKVGQYGCLANIADPNDRFSYIGQCGTDNRIHDISRCNCKMINGSPYCQ